MGGPKPLTFLCPLPALPWKYCSVHLGLCGAWSENHSSREMGILLLLKWIFLAPIYSLLLPEGKILKPNSSKFFLCAYLSVNYLESLSSHQEAYCTLWTPSSASVRHQVNTGKKLTWRPSGTLLLFFEFVHFHCSLSCIGEGNGNPLQCSCLEDPRDGGASWAAVYGVAQSQTRLKRLSSSSSSSMTSRWDYAYAWEAGMSFMLLVTKSRLALGYPLDWL